MNSSKLCNKCNQLNTSDSIYCINCGNNLNVNIVVNNEINNVQTNIVNPANEVNNVQDNTITSANTVNVDSSSDEKIALEQQLHRNKVDRIKCYVFGSISLICILLSLVLFILIYITRNEHIERLFLSTSWMPLVGIILLIIGSSRYPNNKFLKFVKYVLLGIILCGIIGIIYLYISCVISCITCEGI